NGKAWKQPIFYPFMQVSNYGRGNVLTPSVESETYASKDFSKVPYVETIAVHNEEENEVVVFAVNRSKDESIDFTTTLNGFDLDNSVESTELAEYDIKLTNEKDHDGIKLTENNDFEIKGNELVGELKPLSWNTIRIKIK